MRIAMVTTFVLKVMQKKREPQQLQAPQMMHAQNDPWASTASVARVAVPGRQIYNFPSKNHVEVPRDAASDILISTVGLHSTVGQGTTGHYRWTLAALHLRDCCPVLDVRVQPC